MVVTISVAYLLSTLPVENLLPGKSNGGGYGNSLNRDYDYSYYGDYNDPYGGRSDLVDNNVDDEDLEQDFFAAASNNEIDEKPVMKKRGEYAGTDSKRISRRQGSSGSL